MQTFITDQNQVEKIEGMTVEFPYCMHERNLTDFVVPWHWHDELELGYIEKGTSVIRTIDQDYPVHQGNGFFINANVMDTKINGNPGQPAMEINHIFHPIFIGGHFGSRITSKYMNPILQNHQISVHVIQRGTKEADAVLNHLILLKEINAEPGQEIAIRNTLSTAWLLLLEEIEKHFKAPQIAETEKQNRIKSMISYIHRNFGNKLALEEIAAAANISPREANRIFQKAIQQTPFEYLMHYRLNRAKELLSHSELSITEISYQCGFTDSTYMGKQFKKAYGITPRDYRRAAHT
jgi:AraC-like DNA-binding protein